MHDTTRPCRLKPGFLQPGERNDWHLLPATRDAVTMCQYCPLRTACATEALEYGTPDGVVQAGIVCRGDNDTRAALQAIAGIPAGGAEIVNLDELRRATHCQRCRARLVPQTQTAGPGEARRGGRGLCKSCHTLATRAGYLQPKRSPRPDNCLDCDLPMVTRRQTIPEGHVVHEARGRCRTCERARRYAEEQTAA